MQALQAPLVVSTLCDFFCLTLSDIVTIMRVCRTWFRLFFSHPSSSRFCFNLAHRAASPKTGAVVSSCTFGGMDQLFPLYLMREMVIRSENEDAWSHHPHLHFGMQSGAVSGLVAAAIAWCRVAASVRTFSVSVDHGTEFGLKFELVSSRDATKEEELASGFNEIMPQRYPLCDSGPLRIKFVSSDRRLASFEIGGRPKADDGDDDDDDQEEGKEDAPDRFLSSWTVDEIVGVLNEASVFELLPAEQRHDDDVELTDRIECFFLRRSAKSKVVQLEAVVFESSDDKMLMNVIVPAFSELMRRNARRGGPMAVM